MSDDIIYELKATWKIVTNVIKDLLNEPGEENWRKFWREGKNELRNKYMGEKCQGNKCEQIWFKTKATH